MNDEIVYPTGNIDSYFSLLSEYFDLLESKDMRVVWVLNADKAVFSNLDGENGHVDHPKTEYVDQLFSFV